MNAPSRLPGRTSAPPPEPIDLDALRGRLAVRLSRTLFLFCLAPFALFVWQAQQASRQLLAAVLVASTGGGAFAAAAFARLRPEIRIGLLLFGGAVVVATGALTIGSPPSVTGGAAVLCLVASFLVNARVALGTTLTAAAWLVVAARLRAGAPPPLGAALMDPGRAANWVRAVATLLALTVVPVSAMLDYIEHLTRASRRRRDLLFAAVREEAERQRSVDAHTRAEADRRREQGLQALGRLGGGFAHECSNYLQVIVAELDLLRLAIDDSTARRIDEGVREMREAVDAAAAVLTRLLALSGRDIVGRGTAVDVAAFVQAAARQLSTVPGLRIRAESHGAVTARADPPSLHGVLLNMALNASEAMANGGNLLLRARPATSAEATETGCTAAIDVQDDGPGMSAATLERLFEPFFTTKGRRGTGLGLHAARRVLESCGGAIRVASTPGGGTTFTLLLPAAEPASVPPVLPPASRRYDARRPVLVVDDDAQVRGAWRAILTRHGFPVFEAENVEEAIVVVRAHPIALVWTDAIMPGRPTRELIEEVRATQPRTSIVICSGHVEEELLRRDLLRGEAEFIAKPCPLEVLVQRALRASAES